MALLRRRGPCSSRGQKQPRCQKLGFTSEPSSATARGSCSLIDSGCSWQTFAILLSYVGGLWGEWL
eukprot:2418280-Amphidinium_carterae.1